MPRNGQVGLSTALASPAVDADFRPALPRDLILSVAIPGEPKAKGRPIVARGRAFTPATTAVAETDLRWAFKSILRGHQPIAGREIAVALLFFCASSHDADLDNLVKLVLDAANKFVWADDSQVVNIRAAVVRSADEPRTLFRAWTIEAAA